MKRYAWCVGIMVAALMLGAIPSRAATVTVDDPSLTGFASVSFTVASPASVGGQGFPGGPFQTWPYGPVSNLGGWADFFNTGGSDTGEFLLFEGCSKCNLGLTTSTPFYSLTGATDGANPSSTFDLKLFTGTFAIDGGGTVSVTPLASTWTMMLIGMAGLGFVACRRKQGALSQFAA
jgi:hypothetical protein